MDDVNVVCELGQMWVCFVMMHYSFSSGTHGNVFTKPSAKIARLNWADVQLLRKWMPFKGASQCCTPVSVKGPSLSHCLSLSSSLYACLCEAHQSPSMVRCDECSCLKENHHYSVFCDLVLLCVCCTIGVTCTTYLSANLFLSLLNC